MNVVLNELVASDNKWIKYQNAGPASRPTDVRIGELIDTYDNYTNRGNEYFDLIGEAFGMVNNDGDPAV